jgi:hypothetical protein
LPYTGDDAVVFRDSELLDIQDSPLFEAAFPAAHTLACLRIAMTVTRAGARLTSTLPGSALGGWDLHPLDNELIFKESSQPPFPSDQPFLVAPEFMVLALQLYDVYRESILRFASKKLLAGEHIALVYPTLVST